jgi:hypothetical protein
MEVSDVRIFGLATAATTLCKFPMDKYTGVVCMLMAGALSILIGESKLIVWASL